MDKYQTYARMRTPGRNQRPELVGRKPQILNAAREVATQFVAERWPTLAGVKPAVTFQRREAAPVPSDLLKRLGLQTAEVGRCRPAVTYTFTFTSQQGTSDGAIAPLVAAVTVDAEQRVIKASLSK